MKRQAAAFFVILLATHITLTNFLVPESSAQNTSNIYIGIDVAYGGLLEAKAAIDQVSSFTNLVVFGSTQVTWFQDRVNESFQYAYDKGLSIISLTPSLPTSSYNSPMGLNETEWFSMAQNRWGDRLLGFYVQDEPGGKQLDGKGTYIYIPYNAPPNSGNQTINYTSPISTMPGTYSQAADQFTEGLSRFLNSQRPPYPYKTYTSDYALYWYDYKSGYDTVFAELGWNYSREINIALCRGAAQAYNKDWGAIITWTYTNPPYIESGEQLYNDMVLAYDNGAKYIIVFDSDENGHSILQKEHLDAMSRFWTYTQSNPPKTVHKSERSAYVLPNAYGFGFRWPTDHIWGIWEADAISSNISKSVGKLLEEYNQKLDIIYNDGLRQGTNGYNQLIYWNVYDPTPPTPTPTPTPSPSPSPSPTPDKPAEPFLSPLIIAVIISSITIGSGLLIFNLRRNKINS